MEDIRVRHYVERAADFYRAVQLMQGDELYRGSTALLAIHCAISYADALRSGLGAQDLTSEDHSTGADVLKRLLGANPRTDQSGLDHLRYLLSKKSLVAHQARRLSVDDHMLLISKSEKFVNWANKVSRKLNIEGWKHEYQ